MFVIQNKYTKLFIRDKYFNEDVLNNARVFNNKRNASLSIQNDYHKDKNDFEVIEVELKIK